VAYLGKTVCLKLFDKMKVCAPIFALVGHLKQGLQSSNLVMVAINNVQLIPIKKH
jgi:hypothetical protein